MGTNKASYWLFDKDGKVLTGGDMYLPDQLDWMGIEVKADWFRFMGRGPAQTKYALFSSQGEQRLLIDLSLTPLDYTQYKERLEKSHEHTDRFIEEGGHSRKPRNQ